jgi:Zn-dependent protease
MGLLNLKEGIIWYLVFLFSTVVHEASHAFSAFKFGDPTAYHEGQVSLNPIPHLQREPMGTIVVPILSYLLAGWVIGWASTPYNIKWADSNPKKAGMMAAAGPLSNLVLLLLTALIIRVGIGYDLFYPHPYDVSMASLVEATEVGQLEIVAKILSIMFSMNLILFLFNIIPMPPLDGSGMLSIFFSDERGKRYLKAIRNPGFAFIGIFVIWKVMGIVIIEIFIFAVNLLYPGGYYG